MISLLWFWFSGAAMTCALSLTFPSTVVKGKDKIPVEGLELVMVNLLVILLWPFFMIPALIDSLKE